MKQTITIIASIVMCASSFAEVTNAVPSAAEFTNALCVIRAYRKAQRINGVVTSTKSPDHKTTGSSTEPTLKQLQEIAKEQRSRFAVIKKTINRYDPAKTNIFARPARASMQTKLDSARKKAIEYWTNYTNQIVQTVAYSNAYVIAHRVAESATKKIEDEITDLRTKIVKYEEYKTKYPILKTVWNALIEDAENRIKILETLNS